jgi:hypothetical protein
MRRFDVSKPIQRETGWSLNVCCVFRLALPKTEPPRVRPRGAEPRWDLQERSSRMSGMADILAAPRRRFQFRLRTLMIGVTLFCVTIGGYVG